jgi:hypothetical protein
VLTVAAASAALALPRGKSAAQVFTLSGNGTYAGPVSLSIAGLPSGVTTAWSSNPLALAAESGKTTLTLTAAATAKVASTAVTVTAKGDGVTATKQFMLQVE